LSILIDNSRDAFFSHQESIRYNQANVIILFKFKEANVAELQELLEDPDYLIAIEKRCFC
jgi:hypothetical protein